MYILGDVKKVLPMVEVDTVFDGELILYINAIFGKLSQLGFPYAEDYPIINETTKWTDLMGEDTKWEIVKTYICLNVRIMFDPPASSVVMTALNNQVTELEWRIVNNLNIKGGETIE